MFSEINPKTNNAKTSKETNSPPLAAVTEGGSHACQCQEMHRDVDRQTAIFDKRCQKMYQDLDRQTVVLDKLTKLLQIEQGFSVLHFFGVWLHDMTYLIVSVSATCDMQKIVFIG